MGLHAKMKKRIRLRRSASWTQHEHFYAKLLDRLAQDRDHRMRHAARHSEELLH